MGENELAGVHAVVVEGLAEALSYGRNLVRYPFCFKQDGGGGDGGGSGSEV